MRFGGSRQVCAFAAVLTIYAARENGGGTMVVAEAVDSDVDFSLSA